jgi:hypothetical protein
MEMSPRKIEELAKQFDADLKKAEELAEYFFVCDGCGVHTQVTEYDPTFPYPEGWELIEDQTLIELGAKPYWICPKCQKM